jgi:hypothetical protein
MIKKVTEQNDNDVLKARPRQGVSESGDVVIPEGVAQSSHGRGDYRDSHQGHINGQEEDGFYSRGGNASEQQIYNLQTQHNDEGDIDATQLPVASTEILELQHDEETSLRSRSLFGDSDYSCEESEATSKAWD